MGELDGPSNKPNEEITRDDFISEKADRWSQSKDWVSAHELVIGGFVENQTEIATEAAEFILSQNAPNHRIIQGIAKEVLEIDESEPQDGEELATQIGRDLDKSIQRIRARQLKAKLHDSPRNGILWVELSKTYLLQGQLDQARKAMLNAVYVAPNSRYVLRSFARLFVHLNDPEVAHDILRRSPMRSVDPWIMAAEISTAMVATRAPTTVKTARVVLGSDWFSDFQLFEVAGSLSTLEHHSGSNKKARRLMQLSIVDPTDNSVAQAEWISRDLTGLSIDLDSFGRLRIYEARALDAYYRAKNWDEVIRDCKLWQADEPFSVRPALLGSFIATTVLEDHALAEKFAVDGLASNPDDTDLRNNLAVALACQDRLDEAVEQFAQIGGVGRYAEAKVAYVATEGLISFRQGNYAKGAQKYSEAIELADKLGSLRSRKLAELHLIRELVLAHLPGASAKLPQMQEEIGSLSEPVAEPLLRSVMELVKKEGKDKAESRIP